MTIFHLIYSSYYKNYNRLTPKSICFIYTCPNHLSLFSIVFSTRCYPNTHTHTHTLSLSLSLSLSHMIISYHISFSFTTRPTQHHHLCYAYFTLMFVLHRPSLCCIQLACWSSHCLVKYSFRLEWYFHIT